jgi:hypothetical protein
MVRIAEQALPVTGGVDTHADVHVAAVVDHVGRVLGTGAFPATAAGYRAARAWMGSHGELPKVGVEGTGSYGCGLARYLATRGAEVAEVIRPNRQARRQRGKSDAADAVAAALAALNGEAAGIPKSHDGAAESIRAPGVARCGAAKARTQAGNQLRDLIVTVPETLRQQLAALPRQRQVEAATRFRPRDLADPCQGHQSGDGFGGPPPPGAEHRERPARRRIGGTCPARRPGALPRQAGHSHPGCQHAAGDSRRQPGPAAQRGEFRRVARRQPGRCLLR